MSYIIKSLNEIYLKIISQLDYLLTISKLKEDYTMTHLKVGDVAPDFNLPINDNKNINLSEIKDKFIILYFYPKDDTSGCTIEAKDFNGLKDKFEKSDAIVFGVSKDDLDSHKKFKDKYELSNLELLSDKNSDICEKYGVWGKKSMMGKEFMGISRTTFLIDKSHKIAHIWEDVKSIGHAEEVLKFVETLKS